MAVPVIVAASASGSTGALGSGVSSGVLYTCPASTTARICALTVSDQESGVGDSLYSIMVDAKKTIEYAWHDTLLLVSVRDKFIYLTAGDELKIRNDDGSSRTFEYYFSLLEQS